MNNKVSIIVPCYNQAQYLDECLQSVWEQIYENWECIIVNDGSPDNTHEVAKEWLAKDKRFNYIYKENGGLSSARNAGITKAMGEFILPLDADDRISSNYLDECLVTLKSNLNCKIVYGKGIMFGERNEIWELPKYSFDLLLVVNHIFCCALFYKADWERVNGYDEKLIYGYEDWDFWISILDFNSKVIQNKKCDFFYRIKQESMITDLITDTIKINFTRNYIVTKHLNKYFPEGIYNDFILYKESQKKNRKHIEQLRNLENYLTYKNMISVLMKKIEVSFKRK